MKGSVRKPDHVFDQPGRYTIAASRQAELKIKRSVFICHIGHTATISDAKEFIAVTAKENKTATHNCWAYVIGSKGDVFHCSDAGEPSGTAGRPMLQALHHHRLTDVAAVVTRFFGGVKLGVRGLIDAYGQVVRQAVAGAPLHRVTDDRNFEIEVAYPFNEAFLQQLSTYGGTILHSEYKETVRHRFRVEKTVAKAVRQWLTSLENADASLVSRFEEK